MGFNVKDVAFLSVLQGQFVKDRYQVYFQQRPVKAADVNSFRVLNICYARDTARVFYYGYHNDVYNGINEIHCNAASFSILEYPYSRDNESVFYIYSKINGADANSFTIVGNDFSKDNNHVYFGSKILKGADPLTFMMVPHAENSVDEINYSKDQNHIYWKDKMLGEVNVAAFKVLGLGYATDGRHIYFQAAIVKNADPVTFKIYEHGYGDGDAEDAANKYLEGKKVYVQ